jgi:hypothetical protein
VAQALQQMLALACKHDTAVLVLAKAHVQQEVKAAAVLREGEEERSRTANQNNTRMQPNIRRCFAL